MVDSERIYPLFAYRPQQQQRPQEQRQEQQPQPRRERSTGWFEKEWNHDNWEYLGFPEDMDEISIEPLLDVYDWEKMNPKDRWGQQQMLEIEEFIVQEQIALEQDDIEQLQQIEAVQLLQEEQQRQRNEEQLAQMQQWEHIAFLIQQINKN
jgi:hypothetical protein